MRGAVRIRRAAGLLFLVSAALLLGALGFQYLGGLPPCELCYWQRYAHLAVLLVAGLALVSRMGWLVRLAVLAMLVAAGLGLYHAGIEQGWWQGVTACTSGLAPGATAQELLEQIWAAPLTRCDQIPWQFLGLSMAAWNALVSASAALAAILLLRRR